MLVLFENDPKLQHVSTIATYICQNHTIVP